MEKVLLDKCIDDIKYYFDNTDGGWPHFVNVEDWDYLQILQKQLEADDSKKVIRISDFTKEDSLPAIDDAISFACKESNIILIGLSQACYLQSQEKMNDCLQSLLNKNIYGHLLILTIACHDYFTHAIKRDHRLRYRITFTSNRALMPRFPSFIIANSLEQTDIDNCINGCKEWLIYLENLTTQQSSNTLDVYTMKKSFLFQESKYFIKPAHNIFEIIEMNYCELTGRIKEEYGTDKQWKWLLEHLRKYNSFSAVMENIFGKNCNVSGTIINISSNRNNIGTDRHWLAWIALLVFGSSDNKYLDIISRNCSAATDFVKIFIQYLANIDFQQGDFDELYQARKSILRNWDIDKAVMDEYCQKITVYEKDEIFYLTDITASERLKFLKSLAMYHDEWEEDELIYCICNKFPSIYKYMQKFVFSDENVACSTTRTDILDLCNTYFVRYKWYKLCNYIDGSFIDIVNKLAIDRIYTSIQYRSKIVRELPDKESSRLYFFDALGVEYLSYFISKCEEYKIFVDTKVCSCNLPSITSKNKEFVYYFSNIKKISYLDDLKHRSQEYDYEKCKFPIQLFAELKVIDDAIELFSNDLSSGEYKRIYVVADHGASRLAVIHNHTNNSTIEMEERGKHSGRCCPLNENPNIEYACYEDGYAVLANYDRFKGSRLADVEVHGGATLEEVLVPIITLSLIPKKIEINLKNKEIHIKNGVATTLTINANGIIKEPYIYIEGNIIKGTHKSDKHNIDFDISQLRGTKTYSCDIYDGMDNIYNGTPLATNIEFSLKKKLVKHNDMFDI